MLTDKEYEEIADKIVNSTANVYEVAKEYDHEWTDEDFEKLKDKQEIFRCVECSTWKDTCEEAGEDMCCECAE